MLIVAIDTGLRACGLGIADIRTGRIVHGSLVKNPEQEDTNAKAWLGMAIAVRAVVASRIQTFGLGNEDVPPPVSLLVVERQFISPITKNPNQLIGLTCCVGTILASIRSATKLSVYPSQWKGSTKKDRSNRGIWAQLTDNERMTVRGTELKTTGHNVLDAVGIAKWATLHFDRLTGEQNGRRELDADESDPGLAL